MYSSVKHLQRWHSCAKIVTYMRIKRFFTPVLRMPVMQVISHTSMALDYMIGQGHFTDAERTSLFNEIAKQESCRSPSDEICTL